MLFMAISPKNTNKTKQNKTKQNKSRKKERKRSPAGRQTVKNEIIYSFIRQPIYEILCELAGIAA